MPRGSLAALAMMAAAAAPCAHAAPQSAITRVEITRSAPAGTFGGVAYRRVEGTIHGVVAANEPVAGLRAAAAGRDLVPYDTRFELIAPEDPAQADGVITEAPNRGRAILLRMLSVPEASPSPIATEAAIRDGFLFAHRLSLASVQWQAGVAPGVPQAAQGVGEVIVRDFGRWLGGAFPAARAGLPVFRHRILAGGSQSAWFVNSFIAEGFNVDPDSGRGVYQGAFTRDGAGVVLAINRFAGGGPQFPYVPPAAPPLTPAQLFFRPASDPAAADVIAFTDFYRVRASLFARAPATPRLHRYASAAPHASAAVVPAAQAFETMKCNGAVAIPLSPVDDTLYLRPLLLGLANAVGVATGSTSRLPPDAPLALEPAPAGLREINRLAGTPLWTPRITADGQVLGGLPMIEAVLPLGRPEPPALPPVGVSSIRDACGNFAGWRAFTPTELARRYGSRAAYVARARAQAATLVRDGYLLAEDQEIAVRQVVAQLPDGFR